MFADPFNGIVLFDAEVVQDRVTLRLIARDTMQGGTSIPIYSHLM